MSRRPNQQPWPALALVALAAATPTAGGCLDAGEAVDYGDPTELDALTTSGGISARVIAPRVETLQEEPSVRVELVAFTDPPAELEVRFEDAQGGTSIATAEGAPGPEQRFVADLPLLHGTNRFGVRIFEPGGLRTRRFDLVARYEGPAPGLRFGLFDVGDDGVPCGRAIESGVTGSGVVCVRGQLTASSPTPADQSVTLDAGGASVVVLADANGVFQGSLPIAPDARHMVNASVEMSGWTTRVSRPVIQDGTAPSITAPLADASPSRTDAARLRFTGTVSDANGVARLMLINGGGGVVDIVVAPNWSRDVRLEPGENLFTLRAVDHAGNERELSIVVIRDRLIRLGPPGDAGHAVLELDRAGLDAVVSESVQRTTDVVTISLRTPVVNALYRIRDPERHGVDTTTWGQGEWNLNELLNMTPDTADLSGSSLEELLTIAPSVGLPTPRILAQLVDITPTDTFVDIERVADAVLDLLIATHGNIAFDTETGDPALALSLHDVLNDLAPVAPRFGPLAGHPGFLTGDSASEVFEAGFLMSIPARSNLFPFEGVDAARAGKSYLFRLQGEDSLELDFLSDDFAVVGLVDEPVVDLRFALSEAPAFLGVATTEGARPDTERPGFARGDGDAFAAAPWHLEHIVAEAAYRQFHPLFAADGHQRELRYDAGAISDAAVITWDRGWASITTSGNLGSPPAPTYFWDVIAEVAQLRLHDGGIPEGAVDLDFLLEGIPVGLDADGLIETLRPTLQAESADLAASLVSADGLVESRVDLYFVPATDGGPGFLFFRAPEDATGAYDYATPGFFADAALTTKVSTTAAMPGTDDTTHEKLVPVAGQTLFFVDDAGQLFSLEIVEVDGDGVALRVIPQPAVTP